MCGRIAMCVARADEIPAALHVAGAAWADSAESTVYSPRDEVRPTTRMPVAVASASAPASLVGAGSEASPPPVTVHFMRWGLIPCFAGADYVQTNPPLINARGETVLEKPSFRCISAATGSRRCVVVTSGYYEWYTYPEAPGPARGRPPAKKIPYLIHHPGDGHGGDAEGGQANSRPRHGRPLLLAGVYDTWRLGAGSADGTASFALVTMAANGELDWLHRRQPVFLTSDEAVRLWLDPDCPPERACKVAFATAEATRGLAWTRMVKDLSAAAPPGEQGKPKPPVKIAAIDSFFSARRAGASSGHGKAMAPPSPSIAASPPAGARKRPRPAPVPSPRKGRPAGESVASAVWNDDGERAGKDGEDDVDVLRVADADSTVAVPPVSSGGTAASRNVVSPMRGSRRSRGGKLSDARQRRIGDFFASK
jgi:putative SOS response-associated peptidase YedK